MCLASLLVSQGWVQGKTLELPAPAIVNQCFTEKLRRWKKWSIQTQCDLNANFMFKLKFPQTRNFVFLTVLEWIFKIPYLNKTAKGWCTNHSSISLYRATAFSLDLSKLNMHEMQLKHKDYWHHHGECSKPALYWVNRVTGSQNTPSITGCIEHCTTSVNPYGSSLNHYAIREQK